MKIRANRHTGCLHIKKANEFYEKIHIPSDKNIMQLITCGFRVVAQYFRCKSKSRSRRRIFYIIYTDDVDPGLERIGRFVIYKHTWNCPSFFSSYD